MLAIERRNARKTYGGAVLNESFNTDLPYTVRKKANVECKQQIAEMIADMIRDGDHLMLDASSTALFIAKRMKDKKNITVITNSVEILLELSDRNGWKILSTGGRLKEGGLALVGYQAERMISTFYVDYAIFSCKGIDMEHGITDANESDAQIKKMISRAAKKKILAVDHSKFDRVSFTQVCGLSGIDMIVTDERPAEIWRQELSSAGIELVYPKQE